MKNSMKRLFAVLLCLLLFVLLATTYSAHAGSSYAGYIHGMDGPGLTGIYHRGIQHGNRAGVFVKAGDSITMPPHYLIAVGDGATHYGEFGYLSSVVEEYRKTETRPGLNSFNAGSAAARGFFSYNLISGIANERFGCGETPPLQCEYDQVHPSLSIIMIGTNDAYFFTPLDTYETAIRQIIELTLARDIIPVISTIPPMHAAGRDPQPYNAIILRLAAEYEIPWMDFYSLMVTLPNEGLSGDGVHPSIPADGSSTADFTPYGLESGYNNRNVLTLYVLQQFQKQVIHGH